jgi:GT2 family glycosyltransferase
VLESSFAALSPQDEVIVVDGDPERSGQSVVSELQARHHDLRARYLPSETGMTIQRNVGIDAAQGEIIVFTDDDCTFPPTMFDALIDAYSDATLVGVTGFVTVPRSSRLGSSADSRLRWLLIGGGREGTMTSFGFRRPIVRVEQARDVEFMPGSFMSARRRCAAEVRFDERLTGYGLGEDDDFSYRLSRLGRVRYEPSIIVDHDEIGFRTMDSRARDRRQVINRTYLFQKNFANHRRAKVAYVLLIAMMFAHRMLNREWEGLRGMAEGVVYVFRNGAQSPEGSSVIESPNSGSSRRDVSAVDLHTGG